MRLRRFITPVRSSSRASRCVSASSCALAIAIAACAAYRRTSRRVSLENRRGSAEYAARVPITSPCATSGIAIADLMASCRRGVLSGCSS